jgi:hypothetical protein
VYPSSAVIASVVVITSTTIIRRIREGKWEHHIGEVLIFGWMLLVALMILAIISPTMAKTLAYLGIVGAFVVNGPQVFKLVGSFGRGTGAV